MAGGVDDELEGGGGVLGESDASTTDDLRDDGLGHGLLEPDLDELGGEEGPAHGRNLVVVDDGAVVDDDHAPGDVLDVGHVVRGQEHGGAAFLVDPDQELPEALLAEQVEADGRLVEEEDLRLVEHAGGQLAAHPLAEGERADRHVEEVVGLEQVGEVVGAALELAVVEAVDGAEHAERLAGGELEPELRPLAEEGADAAGELPALLPGNEAEDGGRAAGGVEDAGEHLDARRLPGAVGADVGEALAGFDGEGDVADGLDGAPGTAAAAGGEALGQPIDVDRCCATRLPHLRMLAY
jgi:hypothetical protein